MYTHDRKTGANARTPVRPIVKHYLIRTRAIRARETDVVRRRCCRQRCRRRCCRSHEHDATLARSTRWHDHA